MLDFFLDIDTNDIKNFGTKESVEGTGKIASIFSAIDQNINSELVKKTDAVYQFIVKGKFHTISHYCFRKL